MSFMYEKKFQKKLIGDILNPKMEIIGNRETSYATPGDNLPGWND